MKDNFEEVKYFGIKYVIVAVTQHHPNHCLQYLLPNKEVNLCLLMPYLGKRNGEPINKYRMNDPHFCPKHVRKNGLALK